MTFLIRRATPHDSPRLSELFNEAAERLGQAGYDQWQYGPEERERVRQQMESNIAIGSVWVVVSSDQLKDETIAIEQSFHEILHHA